MPGIIGGVYYFIFIAGIMLAIWWCVTAESTADNGSTRGLFAMRKPPLGKPDRAKRKPEGESIARN